MPDAMIELSHLDALSPFELEVRLQQIRSQALTAAKARGIPQIEAFRELSTEDLREIAVIAAKLRNLKASGPGRAAKRRDLPEPRSKDEAMQMLNLSGLIGSAAKPESAA